MIGEDGEGACLEIEMGLAIATHAEGLVDRIKWSAIQKAVNGRHVVRVAITGVSPKSLHLHLESRTFVIRALQRLAKWLPPQSGEPDVVEPSGDFSSVEIHLDQILLPLSEGFPPLPLTDLISLHRCEIQAGVLGGVKVDFEMRGGGL